MLWFFFFSLSFGETGTVLLILVVSIAIPLVWRSFGAGSAFRLVFVCFVCFFFFLKKKNCRYISLPDYASHGFNTNVGHLLSDGDIMKLDADLLELGTLIGKGGQGGRNMRN